MAPRLPARPAPSQHFVAHRRPHRHKAGVISLRTPAALVARCAALGALLFCLAACGQRGGPPAPSPAGYVRGSVMLSDAAAGGHAGVLVYVAGTSASARSDENGGFLISGVPAGEYAFVAEKTGYNQLTLDRRTVDPRAHTRDTPLEIKTGILEKSNSELTTAGRAMKPLGGVRGTVTVMNAQSGENVRVSVDGTAIVTVTDEAGLFRLLNLDVGEHILLFAKGGFKPQRVRVKVEAEKESMAPDVILEPEATPTPAPVPVAAQPTPETTIVQDDLKGDRVIQGIVELTDGAGATLSEYSRVTVSLDNSDYVVTPDESGKFRFDKLAPGVYAVLGVLDNQEPVRQLVDLTGTKSAQIKVKLAESATVVEGEGSVTGRVLLTDAGGAQVTDGSGVTVGVAGSQLVALTGRDGRFTLDRVPVGTVSVSAAKEGFEPASVEGVRVNAGQSTDVGDIQVGPKRDAPRVISTSPSDGAADVVVAQDLVVQVKFNRKMNPDSVRGAVVVQPDGAFRVFVGRGTHPLADDDALVIVFSNLDENRPIKYNTRYRITIARSASDLDGAPMREDYAFSFGTGGAGIVGTTPADGARDAYVTMFESPISIVFNTRLKIASLDNRSIRIRPEPEITPQIQADSDPRTGWTTVRLLAQCKPRTDYTVTVTRNVRSFNGQAISKTPYTFHFRTADPAGSQGIRQPVRR